VPGPVAFVLGGGGILGASEVGMLRALLVAGILPDLVVGTSVGALNGCFVAADPSAEAVERLTSVWSSVATSGVFTDSVFLQATRVATLGTHLHSNAGLRRLIDEHLPAAAIEDLPVTFQCVAASIERASAHWFTTGPVADAVLASCAVPGLLPPVRVGDSHYLDGGLVHSIPVGRAVHLGARRIYVLHVGRIEHPLRPPRRPWEVGLVAFEIARRHRFVEELAAVPPGVELHLLPSGVLDDPGLSMEFRGARRVARRIDSAFGATSAYLAGLTGHAGIP